MKALEARARMLGDLLDLPERREATNCDIEVMARNVAGAQGDITDRMTGLRRETVCLYDSLCRGVDGALLEFSRRLKELFDLEARNFSQSVHKAARGAVDGTRGLFANALATIKKRLGVIVGRAAEAGESAKPDASSSHITSRGAQPGAFRNCSSSEHGSQKEMPLIATPNLLGAHDPFDQLEYGA